MVPATIGQRVVESRRRRGWTQAQLARELSLSDSYVSLIESDKRLPSRRVLELLADCLGCTVGYLGTGQGGDATRSVELELKFAELARRSGDTATARDRFSKVLAQVEALGDAYRDEACEALWGLSRAQEALGELSAAITGFTRLSRAESLPATVSRTSVTTALALTYAKAGDLAHAVEVGERALQDAAEAGIAFGTDEAASELASTLVYCYYERGDFETAQMLARTVVREAERGGSLQVRGAAYWSAGLVAEARGDLRSACALTERALALYAEMDNARAVASLRVNSAWLLLRLPEPDCGEATRLLQNALPILTDVATTADVVSAETELARCHLLSGEPEAAAEIAGAALERLGSPCLESARTRLVLAEAQLALGETDLAVEDFVRAGRELDEAGAPRQAAAVWRELGDALALLGRTDEALRAYRRVADATGVPTVSLPAVPWRAAGEGAAVLG